MNSAYICIHVYNIIILSLYSWAEILRAAFAYRSRFVLPMVITYPTSYVSLVHD